MKYFFDTLETIINGSVSIHANGLLVKTIQEALRIDPSKDPSSATGAMQDAAVILQGHVFTADKKIALTLAGSLCSSDWYSNTALTVFNDPECTLRMVHNKIGDANRANQFRLQHANSTLSH